MALALAVTKIVLNNDKTIRIDEEHIEVTKFKRALIDAVVSENERSVNVALIVDTRARIMTITCKDTEMSPGRIGVGILTEFQLISGYDAMQLVHDDPRQMKDVGRFPVGPDVDQFLGFLHIMKERGPVELRGTGPVPAASAQGVVKTQPIREDEKSLLLRGLLSDDSEVRVQAAMDLKALSYRFVILEDDELVHAINHALIVGDQEVVHAMVDTLLGFHQSGTDLEQKVAVRWTSNLKQIALSSARPDVAGRAFYILVLRGDPFAAEILREWIPKADDGRYANLNAAGFLRTALAPALRVEIREVMYGLLANSPPPNIRNRIAEVLDAIRWT